MSLNRIYEKREFPGLSIPWRFDFFFFWLFLSVSCNLATVNKSCLTYVPLENETSWFGLQGVGDAILCNGLWFFRCRDWLLRETMQKGCLRTILHATQISSGLQVLAIAFSSSSLVTNLAFTHLINSEYGNSLLWAYSYL